MTIRLGKLQRVLKKLASRGAGSEELWKKLNSRRVEEVTLLELLKLFEDLKVSSWEKGMYLLEREYNKREERPPCYLPLDAPLTTGKDPYDDGPVVLTAEELKAQAKKDAAKQRKEAKARGEMVPPLKVPPKVIPLSGEALKSFLDALGISIDI